MPIYSSTVEKLAGEKQRPNRRNSWYDCTAWQQFQTAVIGVAAALAKNEQLAYFWYQQYQQYRGNNQTELYFIFTTRRLTQVLFSKAIENIQLMHVCFQKQEWNQTKKHQKKASKENEDGKCCTAREWNLKYERPTGGSLYGYTYPHGRRFPKQ